MPDPKPFPGAAWWLLRIPAEVGLSPVVGRESRSKKSPQKGFAQELRLPVNSGDRNRCAVTWDEERTTDDQGASRDANKRMDELSGREEPLSTLPVGVSEAREKPE